jgi:hypothetical protein
VTAHDWYKRAWSDYALTLLLLALAVAFWPFVLGWVLALCVLRACWTSKGVF